MEKKKKFLIFDKKSFSEIVISLDKFSVLNLDALFM